MIAAAASSIATRIQAVRRRVEVAAERGGRDPRQVTIVAAAKTHAPSMVAEAIAGGIRDIGENRVQEWRAKRDALADGDIRWHLIGALQKNKVRDVVGQVVLIHSVDSVELARVIGTRATDVGVVQDVLLEVNVSGEATKHGIERDRAEAAADEVGAIEGIRLTGFMTIPPFGDPDAARGAFRWLRGLRDRLRDRLPEAGELSMGMSDDFEIGIEEGSTLVRIGTAIFGPREV